MVKLVRAQDTSYYADGKIQEIGINKENGNYQLFHPNGEFKIAGAYRNKIKIGEWKEYSADGKLLELTKYENGNEIEKQWFYSGLIARSESYQRDGIFIITSYFENGQISEIGKCKWNTNPASNNEKCTKIGKWRTYHENGQLKAVGKYSSFKERTGLWKSYHSNGKLAEKGKYNQSGESIGKWKFYDTNGRRINSYSYED
jgi:antitoxin component YwqK of YwqJK toxin-antitoxin module